MTIPKVLPWAILAAVLIVGYVAYRDAHEEIALAKKGNAEKQQAIDALKVDRKAIDAEAAKRDAVLHEKIAEIERLMKLKPPVREVVREIHDIIPNLPGAPTLVEPAEGAITADGKPQQPSVLFSPEQVEAVRLFSLGCQKTELGLSRCQESVEEFRKRELNYKDQIKLTEAQRDEWKTAAKGGSFWIRFHRDARSGLGAAAGATVGAGLCSKSSGAVIAGCAGFGAGVGFLAAHL